MHGKFDDLGRFADPSVLILTSLSDGPKHGYALMTAVAAFSDVRMEPGTLYGALSRLEKRGWIRPLDTDERRRPYHHAAAHRGDADPRRRARQAQQLEGTAALRVEPARVIA